MRAVANGKILSLFITSWQTLKQKNHKFQTNSSTFTKQDVLEKMFILTTSQHPHPCRVFYCQSLDKKWILLQLLE